MQPTHGEEVFADKAARGMYYDYKHGRMRKLTSNGTRAVWVGAVAKVSRGRTKAKKGDLKEDGKCYNIRDQTLVIDRVKPQLRGRGDE